MEIKNQHILITGSTRGIGYSLSQMLAAQGAHLHLVSRKHSQEVKNELLKLGAASVSEYEVDISSTSMIDNLIKNLNSQSIEIDILINNAGFFSGGLFERQSFEDIQKMMTINLSGPIYLTSKILPRMLSRKRGKIVNNASLLGLLHIPGSAAYSATKAGLIAFTNCLKSECQGTGVTTLLLLTPAIKSRISDQVDDQLNSFFKRNKFEIPLKSLSPQIFSEMVKEAILLDLEILNPPGVLGLTKRIAQYLPPLYEFIISKTFKRSDLP